MRPAVGNGNGRAPSRSALITGGAGFVGTNLAARLLERGERVLVYDNLARPGVERNLAWLQERYGERVEVCLEDLRDQPALRRAAGRAGSVFHLAAQVAVTTSLDDPGLDFDVNVRGTFQLLEALRSLPDPPPLLFTSTNKVYGALEDLALTRGERRYAFEEEDARRGVSEERALDFHTPYGCSKGAADQYVLDYARCFGLRAVVFRMSCIYGPHQMGTEDQGWVAHLVRLALRGEPIQIYGDGRQVRDLLFVDDLVEAMLRARERATELAGRPFNVGGGPLNTCSLLELVDLIAELEGRRPEVSFGPWRPGDQACYVSDIRRISRATGWRPRVGVREGVARLHAWLASAGLDATERLRRARVEPIARRAHA